MFSLVLPLVLAIPPADHVAVLRLSDGAKQPLSVAVHGKIDPHLILPPAYANDAKFLAAGGKSPVRFAFGADVDGDGADELVVIREKGKAGRYLVTAFAPPAMPFDDVKVVASAPRKNALGTRVEFGAIVAADAVDVDGDGSDELAVVRQFPNGVQRLELVHLPSGKKQPIGPSLASVTEIGQAPFAAVVSLAGADLQGDGIDEIVLLRDGTSGTRIEVLGAPKAAGTAAVLPMLAADDPVLAPLESTVAIEAYDVDHDGIDELAFVRHGPAGPAVTVYRPGETLEALETLPAGFVEGMFALAILSHGKVGEAAGPQPLVAEELEGKYELTMQHVQFNGYTTGLVQIGPFEGIDADVKGNGEIVLKLPDGKLAGVFSEATSKVDFGANALTFSEPELGVATVSFHSADASKLGTQVLLQGSYAGSITTSFSGQLTIGQGTFFLRKK